MEITKVEAEETDTNLQSELRFDRSKLDPDTKIFICQNVFTMSVGLT